MQCNLRFLSTNIWQGSVATRLRCGGIFNYWFTRKLLLSLSVKEFRKLVSIWQRQKWNGLFFPVSVAAPRLWNQQSIELKLCRSTGLFKRKLNTFLFTDSYGVSENSNIWTVWRALGQHVGDAIEVGLCVVFVICNPQKHISGDKLCTSRLRYVNLS